MLVTTFSRASFYYFIEIACSSSLENNALAKFTKVSELRYQLYSNGEMDHSFNLHYSNLLNKIIVDKNCRKQGAMTFAFINLLCSINDNCHHGWKVEFMFFILSFCYY